MSAREPGDRHSDLGPSSKDWQTGSTGRDEDFTPEKDLWTISRKGDTGAGRPGEDIHPGGVSGSGSGGRGADFQPGTQHEGTSWQSHRPRSTDSEEQLEEELEEELEDTFPASDPLTVTQPGATGWDVERGAPSTRPGRPTRHGEGKPWQQARTGIPGWLWLAAAAALLPVLASAARGRIPQRRSRPPRRES